MEAISGITAFRFDIHLSPREEIQASPETLTKKSAKSTKSFRAACHLRGGLPHVCGFGGAVADTLFLLMGHMSQRLDEALFLTLENYSLMYFKGILMRTLEAQRTQLCTFSFQVPEVWCYLMSLANLVLFLPCCAWWDGLKGPYRSHLPFSLFASDALLSPSISSTAPFWILYMQGLAETAFLSNMFIKDIFWKPINPDLTHLNKCSFSLTTAIGLIFFLMYFSLTLLTFWTIL